AANADVYDVANALAGISCPFTAVYTVAKLPHLFLYGLHLRHYIFTAGINGLTGEIAQSNMQYRTVFGFIDLLTGKHRSDGVLYPAFLRQLQQQLQGSICNAVFGVVEKQILKTNGILAETIGVIG